MEAQELEQQAINAGANPYFFAYALAHNVDFNEASKDRKHRIEFLIWNNNCWEETKKRLGLPLDKHASDKIKEHLETLAMKIK